MADNGTPGTEEPVLPPRLRLGDVVGGAWRRYKENFVPLTFIFAAVGLVTSLTLFIAILIGDNSVGLTVFIVYVAHLLLMSIAIGIGAGYATSVLHRAETSSSEALPASEQFVGSLRGRLPEVATTALFAAMVAAPIRIFGGPFGFLGLLVFGSAPVVMQLVVAEGKPFRLAWPEARILAAGNAGRILLHLLTVSLGIMIVRIAVSPMLAALADGGIGSAAAFVLGETVVTALTLPLLAACAYVCYLWLKSAPAVASPE